MKQQDEKKEEQIVQQSQEQFLFPKRSLLSQQLFMNVIIQQRFLAIIVDL